ncbi:MAG TPA: amino acid--tRNA ligase-related protein, partial [Actinomycetota bacterium]|nr:amino acid--tRNA ligase-related protein [Actinomycetota bacterium]
MPEPPEDEPTASAPANGPAGAVDPPEPADDAEERGRLAAVLAARRDTLHRLEERGIPAFALNFDKDADAADIVREFAGLEPEEETDQVRRVAGRIVLLRRHGGVVFVTIRDRSGDLQLFCSRNAMPTGSWTLLDDLDLGDIVGAVGPVVKTKRGEVSVKPAEVTLLTKSLRPPPEKWAGIRDPELKVRRRYLQLFAEPEFRRVVTARAKVLSTMRMVLDGEGFVEVETPVLQVTHGGALAAPFVTHHNVLDIDLYLRIAPELYLKRLLVGGLERVYEIGRNFRNEGIDRDHNPEFTMLEFYLAYGDYGDMMDLSERLVTQSAMATLGTLTFDYLGREMDLTPPWPRRTVLELVSEAVGEEVTLDRPDLVQLAERHGVTPQDGWGPGHVVWELYEELVEDTLWRPTFVKDVPQ